MQTADSELQEIVHRNASRIQAGLDRMLDRKQVQIEGVRFCLKLRCNLEGESASAYGLVLMGRRDKGDWLPCHC